MLSFQNLWKYIYSFHHFTPQPAKTSFFYICLDTGNFLQVNALLTLSEGAHFLGSSQPFVAEKLRLGPHGATSLVVRVVATSPGLKNMTGELKKKYIFVNFQKKLFNMK